MAMILVAACLVSTEKSNSTLLQDRAKCHTHQHHIQEENLVKY
jgi:hypothetical protein